MNKTLKTAGMAVFLCLGALQTAHAANLRWLNYSPVRFFTDQDWDIATAAGRQALNDTEDGVTVEWKNPASSHYGSLTPLSTATKDGMTCRQLKIVNHANNLDGSSVYEFCKKPDGTWGAVGGTSD